MIDGNYFILGLISRMTQKRYLCIKNFDEQLHYKDKNPVWIKLYCSLLDDYEFAQMPDETKFHAVGLMILAGRLNNRLPEDEVWLRQKINANTEIDLKLLLEIGFLKVAENEKIACKPKKTPGNLSRAVSKSALAQNRTEQKRKEENTTQQNTTEQTRGEPPAGDAAKNGSSGGVCEFEKSPGEKTPEKVFVPAEASNGHKSMFSLADCLKKFRRTAALQR